MSRTPRKADLLQVQRYVDGELAAADRAALEARLGEEPTLLAAVEAARDQCRLFQDDPAKQLPPRKPAPGQGGVVDAVMDQVRRLPRREELVRLVEGDELAEVAAAVGRRWLVAAAVLFVVALLFGARLIQPSGGEARAADETELQKLDDAYRELLNQGKGLPAALSRQRSGR
ncbi:MAG: hypothetical protein ACYST0_03120 [Planctomycetota bacterium]|jgi:anti-sigma factor RsiW